MLSLKGIDFRITDGHLHTMLWVYLCDCVHSLRKNNDVLK